ncbi:MAG: hypothetical protein E6G91_09070 [Alphaproteobacteria bacterium]|nr:MAG: hypothetical protein E6G91_09070 [Alphaproteobacteria bacterium]
MATRARHSTSKTTHDAFDADAHLAHGELWPGERIGPPLRRTRGKAMLRGVIILIALGGCWALLGDQTTWPSWRSIETAVSSWMNRSAPGPVEPTALAMTTSPPARAEPPTKPAAPDAKSSTLQPLAASDVAATPGTAARPAAPPPTVTALPPAATASDELPAEPLPPPAVDPTDPYQVRAAAVGLHPDLSRVLLTRLSPTDYRNAGIAIQTAVAETLDSAVFVWPRQRKPELALFQVRFVPGAAPSCRRYVVSITKDGWLTTAPPMEKCGPQPGPPPRQ